MPYDDEHDDLQEALRTALTRGGADAEVDPAALAAFREARLTDRPARRRDDWTPAAGRCRPGRSLRTILAGLLASAALGGAAIAADLPVFHGDDRPPPTPARDTDPTPSTPHRPPPQADPGPLPSRPAPPESTGKGKGKADGQGDGQGTRNGPPKNDKPQRNAEKPQKGQGAAGTRQTPPHRP